MKAGELCSGYGGLSLAVEAAFGAETLWHAEVDPHASRLLAHHWPDRPNHGDITAIDWSTVEPVDILAGGTPCQDMSSAGLRAGMADDTRSGLWSAMADAIRTLRPSIVIWENVSGALSACASSRLESDPRLLGVGSGGPVLRAAGRVLGDLAALGYDAGWTVVRASDVGACHRRARVWVVARPHSDPDRVRRFRPESEPFRHHGGGDPRPDCLALLPTPTAQEPGGTVEQYRARLAAHDGREATFTPLSMVAALLPTPTSTDAVNPTRWGRYAAAIDRHATTLGRPAPDPTDDKGRLSPRFVEWMMMLPDGWITGHDLPRTAELRCLGNGVVTPQAIAGILAASALLEAAA